jgi:hypothetical protein
MAHRHRRRQPFLIALAALIAAALTVAFFWVVNP